MEPNLTFPEGGGDVRAQEKTPPASQSLKRPEVGIKVITFLRKVCYCFSTRSKVLCLPKALCPKVLFQEQQAPQMWAKEILLICKCPSCKAFPDSKTESSASPRAHALQGLLFHGLPWWLRQYMRQTQIQSLCRDDALENEMQPTPVFLPGKFHGHRRLAVYSPWGLKEPDETERLSHFLWFHNLDRPLMPAVSAWPAKTCRAASQAPPGTPHPE